MRDMAKITLYHGGYMPVEKPEIRISRNTKDFGPGVLLYDDKGAGQAVGKAV